MSTSSERRQDTLGFIQSMLLQLNQMALAERCDMLGYLIEMAYVESGDVTRGDRPLRVQEYKRNTAA